MSALVFVLLVVRFSSPSVKDLIIESKAKKEQKKKGHHENREAKEMRER